MAKEEASSKYPNRTIVYTRYRACSELEKEREVTKILSGMFYGDGTSTAPCSFM